MRKVRAPLGPAVIDVLGLALTDDDRRRLAAYITMLLKQTDVPALVIVPENRDPDQEAI